MRTWAAFLLILTGCWGECLGETVAGGSALDDLLLIFE